MVPEPLGDAQLSEFAAEVMNHHWRDRGFTCPNATTYPWLWLWDSCFHAVIWAELGDAERAVAELETVLSPIGADGFLPHIQYLDGFDGHERFWGRRGTSSITQPPIFGHAIARLISKDIDVPEELVESAVSGISFLLERRQRSAGGLVELVHPWESGCDHSPRWDDLMDPAGTGFDSDVWFERKGQLVGTIARDRIGSPIYNPEFRVGSVAFTALVAFNAFELARVVNSAELATAAAELASCLDERWAPDPRTWLDDGATATGSGMVRTLEALLPILVSSESEKLDLVVEELLDPDAYYADFGLRQVHRLETTYRSDTYWRGPSWPQLNYLIVLGLVRAGRRDAAQRIAEANRRGTVLSGLSEYWVAESGRSCGAQPQSWSALAICADSICSEL